MFVYVYSEFLELPILNMKKKKKGDSDTNNNTEGYLEHKNKKKWVDEKSGRHCFMLYPRSLFITWGQREYWNWDWNCFKETSEENIEVLKLSHVCWLDVRGKLKICDLSPGTVYSIAYEVKLTKGASGWEIPIILRLSLPHAGKVQERQVSLLEKPKGVWMELNVGCFQTDGDGDGNGNGNGNENREVGFDLYEHGGHWKSGLIIRGAIIRPKL